MDSTVGAMRPILVTGGTGTLGTPRRRRGCATPGAPSACSAAAARGRGRRRVRHRRPDHRRGRRRRASTAPSHRALRGEPPRATRRRRGRWSARPRGPGRRHLVVHLGRRRRPGPGRQPASTARCSATSRPSARPSASSPSPACRGRRCARPSSTTCMLTTARQMAKLPVIPVPSGIRFQPVDTGEVADRLVELALGAPGGPRARHRRAAGVRDGRPLRGYLRARGKHRPIVPGPGAGQGGARVPRRREPRPGPRRRPPDVGGVPRREVA